MAIGGLWHGAAWSFAIWGLYHGFGLALERWAAERWPGQGDKIPRWICVCGVFAFVSVGWLLFRLPDFGHVIVYMRCVAENWGLGFEGQKKPWILVLLFSVPVLALHAFAYVGAEGRLGRLAKRVPPWVTYGFLVFAIAVSHGLPGAFIYFQF
jgi:alginate O-acetyltransferase complex protein AlgI